MRVDADTLTGALGCQWEPGTTIHVSGFYMAGDSPAMAWRVIARDGEEEWADTGHGFHVSRRCEVATPGGCKAVPIVGHSATTAQLGCRADGVSDDSVTLRAILECPTLTEVRVSPGAHVINIAPGTTHALRDFATLTSVRMITGTPGKSVIRLGSGNGNEPAYTGFQSVLAWGGADVDVTVTGVTFDYNPAANPVTHYSGRYPGVEANGQHLAINAYRIRNLTVTGCTFTGAGGTNVINYRPHTSNTADALVEIANNAFLDIGPASTYAGQVAYHDHSTVSIHNDDTAGYARTVTANIHHNTFRGVGGNAYDACECSADVQNFHHNTVTGYAVGHMTLAARANVTSRSHDNTFTDVTRGELIWTMSMETTTPAAPGFRLVDIRRNAYYPNPEKWRTVPMWDSHTLTNGAYEHVYAGISWGGPVCRDVDTLTIDGNHIEFIGADVGTLGAWAYNGIGIALVATFNTATIAAFTQRPHLRNLTITDNTIRGCYRGAISYTTYPETTHITITGNRIHDCIHDAAVTASSVDCISVQLIGDHAEFPYVANPLLRVSNTSVVVTDNRVFGTPCRHLFKVSFWDTSWTNAAAILEYRRNVTNVAPSTAEYATDGAATAGLAVKITA